MSANIYLDTPEHDININDTVVTVELVQGALPANVGLRKGEITATTSTTVIDLLNVDYFEITLAVTTTAANIINAVNGKVYSIKVIQDGNGLRELTAGTGWNFGTDVTALLSFASDTANQYAWLVGVGNANGGIDLLSDPTRGFS